RREERCNTRKATPIHVIRRLITNVAVQIGVACHEADRILANPSADLRIIKSCAVVLQPGASVELAGSEAVAIEVGDVGTGRSARVPEAVEGDASLQGAGVVRDAADRTEMIGEVPGDTAGIDAGQELIDAVEVDSAGLKSVTSIEVRPRILAQVGELCRDGDVVGSDVLL